MKQVTWDCREDGAPQVAPPRLYNLLYPSQCLRVLSLSPSQSPRGQFVVSPLGEKPVLPHGVPAWSRMGVDACYWTDMPSVLQWE